MKLKTSGNIRLWTRVHSQCGKSKVVIHKFATWENFTGDKHDISIFRSETVELDDIKEEKKLTNKILTNKDPISPIHLKKIKGKSY